MNYTDIGFDTSLQRDLYPLQNTSSDIYTQDLTNLLPSIPLEKINSQGLLASADGKLTLNMIDGYLSISDGQREVGRLGHLADGTYGISFTNPSGDTTISNLGVSSSGGFQSGSVSKVANQTIVGDSFVDILSLQTSFETTSDAFVLFLATIFGNHQEFDGVLIVQFWLDGKAIGPEIVVGTGGVTLAITGSAQFVLKVPTGHHVLKLRGRGNNASPSEAYVLGGVTPSVLNYIILGK